MGMSERTYITQKEAARRLGCSPYAMGRYIRAGKIKRDKRGVWWPDAIEAYETIKAAPSDGGRPATTFTAAQLDQLEKLAAVLSMEQIAGYFGIDRDTLAAMMKRDGSVLRRYKKGRANAISSVGRGLLSRALEGDTASAIFYLKTQARWSEKQEVEHTVRSPQEAAAALASAMLGDDEED